MDALADAAELSKGTLYLYFRSKEEIHYGITQRGLQKLFQKMKAEVLPQNNAIENLLILAGIFIRYCSEEASVANSILFFQTCELHHLNIDKEKLRDDFLHNSPIQLVTHFVEEGVSQGIIRDDIPVAIISHTLWAQLMGVIQVSAKKKELFDLVGISQENILESHFKIVLNGLRK
jgi:AcrR family transcriptional regulator